MRLLAVVTLATLSALPAAAETMDHTLPPGVNEAVAEWFSHCAAFSTENEVVETLAVTACLDRAVQMCQTAEAIAADSGCFDRLEVQGRTEEAALVPELDRLLAVLPKGFDRQAIEREVERRTAPPSTRPCPDALAAHECGAFFALVDWIDLRGLIRLRSPK